MSDPNQNNLNNQTPSVTPPQVSDQPLVPDFQTTDSTAVPPMIPTTQISDSNPATPTSDIPSSDMPSDLPPVSSGPKKKFGTGKIIATILGFFILVGGIAGGVILTQQDQDIREKADFTLDDYDNCKTSGKGCPSGYVCVASIIDQEGTCKQEEGTPTPASTSNPQLTACIQICVNHSLPASVCETQCNANANYFLSQFPQSCEAKCVNNGLPSTVCATQCAANPNFSVPPISTPGGNTNTCSSQVKCTDGVGCTTGTLYNPGFDLGTGNNNNKECVVYHYKCPSSLPAGTSCDESTGGTLISAGQSASFTNACGVQQIDIHCPNVCNIQGGSNPEYFESTRKTGDCSTGGGGGNPTASCLDVKAYSAQFAALTPTQLSQLKVGDQVNFCVRGAASEGSFDKAKFTINSAAQPETTTKRPSSNDFCQSFTIPAAVTTFNVTAQIHHTSLGYK